MGHRKPMLCEVYFGPQQIKEMAEYIMALYDLVGGAVKTEPGETGWYVGIVD